MQCKTNMLRYSKLSNENNKQAMKYKVQAKQEQYHCTPTLINDGICLQIHPQAAFQCCMKKVGGLVSKVM